MSEHYCSHKPPCCELLITAQSEIQRLKDQGKVNCELFDEVKRQRKEIAALASRLRKLREALENIQKHCTTLTNDYQRLGAYMIAERALKADADEKE